MKPSLKLRLIAVAVAALAAALVAFLRSAPVVQGLELKAYDTFVSLRASEEPSGNPIALAVYDEDLLSDPDFMPHPVPDEGLARVLRRLVDAGAAVVAVDIYRGVPVPKGTVGSPLSTLFQEKDAIIMVRDLDDSSPIRRAPPAIAGNNQRVAVANYPVDPEPAAAIRRGYLTVDKDADTFLSLSFLAALRYLSAEHGLGLEIVSIGNRERRYKIGDTVIRPFHSEDGPYAGADDFGYQLMLEFRHKGNFPERSFRWILEADDAALREFAAGKIVFTGVTAESVKDSFATSLLRDHRGLHLQAAFADQVLSTVLDPAYRQTRVLSDTLENTIIFAWALLGALPALLLRRLPARAAVLALGIVLAGLLSFGLFGANIWIPAVAPMLAFGLSLAGATAVAEYHQRHTAFQLEEIFRRHLGAKQFSLVWGEREALLRDGRIPSRQAEATIMMTDLRGYTTVSEQLSGDTLLAWLNRLHETMETSVVNHNGMVKALIGDAIYAVFGIPASEYKGREGSERQRADALTCGLDMGVRIDKLNAEFRNEGLPEAAIRVGINTGTVTLGTLGSDKGMEYGIIGDVVNTAARLESYDKDSMEEEDTSRVIAGEFTLAGVADHFETRDIGFLELKGKANKFRAFLVTGAKSTP